MFERVVGDNPCKLYYVSDQNKTQVMRKRAVEKYPRTSKFVSDRHKIDKICQNVVLEKPSALEYLHVTQQVCEKVIEKD